MKTLVLLGALLAAALLPDVLIAQDEHSETGRGPFPMQPRTRTMDATACAGDLPIACGNTKSGSLTTDDCVLVDKNYYDGWVFTGTVGQTVTINMSSSNFDTFLILLGTEGIEVADNDDTATTNSQITYQIRTAGTYRILATSSRPSVTGSYTLSLSCADSGTPNLTPYKPATWPDKIIVTLAKESTVQPATYSPTDSLWIQWAIINNGTGPADDLDTVCGLYIDGVRRGGGSVDQTLPAGYYNSWNHLNLSLGAGTHTLTLKADENQRVSESNEADNDYTRTVTIGAGSTGVCTTSATVACLNNRFAVSVSWKTVAASGVGTRTAITGDSAWFWFFSANAAELMVKAVDGRAVNGKFWFFYGALSDVNYTITVTDVQTGQFKTYTNAQGNLASVADTAAF